ncbi:MAG: multidrug effflux MFS transporter [Thalassobaculales bacterium]
MSARSPLRLTLVLGALTAFAPMSVDMYLPSLPDLTRVFATDAASVQLTLSAFLAGLALGQLGWGPLSDRFGRRRPLAAGLAVYIAASAACALATSIEMLIVGRLVQGLGGCAGPVIARAIVRDLHGPVEAARMFSLLMLVMGVAPILAPLAGGVVLELADWSVIFWILALFGAACLAASRLVLAETAPPRPPGGSSVASGYWRLLRDPAVMGHMLSGTVSQAGMFTYIASSPSLFIETYGVAPGNFGWLFGMNAAGLIAASQLNRRLVSRIAPAVVLRAAVLANALLAAGLTLCAATGWGGFPGLLALLFLVLSMVGFTQPNAVSGALARHPHLAGTASALYGFLQFAFGALAAAVVAQFHDGTALPMALAFLATAAAALAVNRCMVQPERSSLAAASRSNR